jgi:hypothetical protein
MTTAAGRLNIALLTMAANGERPRCADPVDHDLWTSESEVDRAMAARWCTGCVVLDLCAAVAVEEDHRWGIWGGRDFTRRPGRKGQAAA